MDWKAVRDWLLICCILFVAIFIIFFVRSESGKCLAQPMVYGLNQLKSDSEPYCTCSVTQGRGSYQLLVNRTTITQAKADYFVPVSFEVGE